MNTGIDSYFLSVSLPIITNREYQSMKKFITHGSYSVYDHSIRVAAFAYQYAKKKNLKLDYRSLIIGSLLHDYYLYDWHHAHEGHRLHGFRHPFIALMKAKRTYSLNNKICNMIRSHMFPLTFWTIPLCKEAWVLSLADKCCAYREHKTICEERKRRKEEAKRTKAIYQEA